MGFPQTDGPVFGLFAFEVQRYLLVQVHGQKDDEEFRMRIQSLLADRFQLKTHKETREEQVYNTSFFVYISTGNDNPGYEYAPIVQINDVGPRQASAHWDGTDQLVVTYPSSATIVDAYAKTFGVRVILNPPLP
jgi:hypothetical protein